MSKSKIIQLTLFSILGFAGNSWLNRFALMGSSFNPLAYSWLRVFSGAIFLLILLLLQGKIQTSFSNPKRFLWPTLALTVYLWGFSSSYTNLSAGTGALVLFTTVQISLFVISLFLGNKIQKKIYLGMAIAVWGLMTLVYPSLKATGFLPIFLMISAGIAWGFYTFLGKKSISPMADNAVQFLGSALILSLVLILKKHDFEFKLNQKEVQAALLSGVLCSGLAYSVWYKVVPNLAITTAALVQLLVPVITFMGGILFLGEAITLPSFMALLMIVAGVGLGVWTSQKQS